jgi:nuclear receptor subfamily 5 group A protein 3
VSQDVSLSLDTAKERQLEKWVEKMLHFSEQLRRLRIDRYEYVSMKVIVLLTADTSDIKERDTVRQSQEKVQYIFSTCCKTVDLTATASMD